MNPFQPPGLSSFMASHLTDFLNNFGVDFSIDGPQLEYFVFQRKTGQDISCSMTIDLDISAGQQINVMTFYPGIYLHPDTRYLSSVCFFMVMQHFANFHHIVVDCRIRLNTCREIFESFYSLLKDFDFHVTTDGEENMVKIESRFLPIGMDTSMFGQRPLPDYFVI